MSEQTSNFHKNFRTRFLLNFTRELIRNTETYKKSAVEVSVKNFILEKKEVQKLQERKINVSIQKVSHGRNLPLGAKPSRNPNSANPFQSFFAQRVSSQRANSSRVQIVESKLPPTVQHIKPIPMQVEINLKKLSPLIKDPLVGIMECNGPGENIFVTGTMGRKRTGIILNKEEVDEIIKIFSESTKIPIEEGMNKFVFGKLVLSAIVSEVIGSKFIIKKMGNPGFPSRNS
ncbi:MAG: hypothetical protein AABX91_00525 [Nanoarchaeota archaeon]